MQYFSSFIKDRRIYYQMSLPIKKREEFDKKKLGDKVHFFEDAETRFGSSDYLPIAEIVCSALRSGTKLDPSLT